MNNKGAQMEIGNYSKVLGWEKVWGDYVSAVAKVDAYRNDKSATRGQYIGAKLHQGKAWKKMVMWCHANGESLPGGL